MEASAVFVYLLYQSIPICQNKSTQAWMCFPTSLMGYCIQTWIPWQSFGPEDGNRSDVWRDSILVSWSNSRLSLHLLCSASKSKMLQNRRFRKGYSHIYPKIYRFRHRHKREKICHCRVRTNLTSYIMRLRNHHLWRTRVDTILRKSI